MRASGQRHVALVPCRAPAVPARSAPLAATRGPNRTSAHAASQGRPLCSRRCRRCRVSHCSAPCACATTAAPHPAAPPCPCAPRTAGSNCPGRCPAAAGRGRRPRSAQPRRQGTGLKPSSGGSAQQHRSPAQPALAGRRQAGIGAPRPGQDRAATRAPPFLQLAMLAACGAPRQASKHGGQPQRGGNQPASIASGGAAPLQSCRAPTTRSDWPGCLQGGAGGHERACIRGLRQHGALQDRRCSWGCT